MPNFGTQSAGATVTHNGTVTIPNTPGQDYCCTVRITGECDGETLQQDQKLTLPVEMPTGDERDQFWADQDYSLACFDSVTTADYGRTAQDYFQDQSGWAKGQGTVTNFFNEPNLSFASAPDGTPAFRAQVNAGQSYIINVKGQQLTQASTVTKAVYSMRIYMPPPKTGQSYVGFGHNWWSAPGVIQMPGGAFNTPNAGSARMIQAASGEMRNYIYPCRPSSSTLFGDVGLGSQFVTAGQWYLFEQEICLDEPAGSGGVIRAFVDCNLTNEYNNVLRKQSNVYHKGQGVFIGHVGGAPATEVIYITDWKIYTQ